MASKRDQNMFDENLFNFGKMSLEDQTPPIVLGTGLVYDERMTRHCSGYKSEPGISENPLRIIACFNKLQESGLIEKCIRVQARKATQEEILVLHSEEYFEKLKATSNMNIDELQNMAEKYDSVFFSQKTFESALISAGGTLELVEQVVRGKIKNGIALVRPPGHHAQYDMACGYSYLNNIALAAWHARYSWGITRVLIIDWDIHHGQGTQYMFEDDPSVLYFSVHRYENAKFWPHLKDSDADKIGKGHGKGFNINIPLNQIGMGDSDYIEIFQKILLPVAHEFNPHLVLVSAGFDSSIGDPKGKMCLTPQGYAHLTHMLMGMAAGKICLVLEGGYNLDSMGEGVLACTRTLLGQPCPTLKLKPPCEGVIQTIINVIFHIKKYWKSLQSQVLIKDEEEEKVKLKRVSRSTMSNPRTEEGIQDLKNATSHINRSSQDKTDTSSISNSTSDNLIKENHENPQITEAVTIGVEAAIDKKGATGFCVYPLSWCPHLETINPLPRSSVDINAHCEDCDTSKENWLCLACYQVHCGRYINKHMVVHSLETGHMLTLSFSDLSVWCYGCDAYIHNEVLIPVKQAVHFIKFGKSSF